MKISIIGAGNLGGALIEALLASDLVSASDLEVFERNTPRADTNASFQFGCSIRRPREIGEPISDSDVVIIAVKPQDSEATLNSWALGLKPSAIIISVMAGLTLSTIERLLNGHALLARAMPNLGALVKESATVFYCHPKLTTESIETVRSIVETFGKSWQVSKEEMVDAATAIAGSGPAYFYWLSDQMIAAAIKLGFDEVDARDLVVQTLRGAGKFLEGSGLSPSEARRQVTSPNGTTAAALALLSSEASDANVVRAVLAAHARAVELSK